LGAQSTVLGGGRYDGLMESLGGPATPAVGWAAGIERLAMLVGEREEAPADVIIVVEDDGRLDEAIGFMKQLRDTGLTAEMIASGSPRKRYDKASKREPLAILSLQSDMRHSVSGDGETPADVIEALRRYS
jgi:histidyl-tRNA synthetase